MWRTRGGKQCTIKSICFKNVSKYPIESDLYYGHHHYIDGRSCIGNGRDNADDLIELISAAPEPEPVPPAECWPLPRLFAAPPVRTWSPDGACRIDALATDGTAWYRRVGDPEWIQHPPLPQPEAE